MANNVVYVGSFLNNLQHGEGEISHSETGEKITGVWENGTMKRERN